MKKKSVFLSKVFAVALAASMAFSTPYASAALVTSSTTYEGAGSVVCTQDSAFWSSWSTDFYRQSGDFDVTFELTNKSDGLQAWNNYLIVFSAPVDYAAGAPNELSGYREYFLLRGDSFGVGDGDWAGNANATFDGNSINYSAAPPEQFTQMMKDAKVTLNVTRKDNDFTINRTITGADSQTFSDVTTFKMAADKDINIFFSGEAADVNILSYTVNNASASTTPETPIPDTSTDTATPPAIDVDPGENTAPATPTDPEPATPTDPEPATPTDPEPETPTDPEPTTPEDPGDGDDEDEPATTKKAAKLSKTKLSIKVGKSKTLKVKNTSKTVKWSSSNKKVAKVKNGKVTGVKVGKATITAKVGNKTLKCKVTVK